MHSTVFVLNGPNLNLLGTREPEIYGSETLDDIEGRVAAAGRRAGFEVVFRQTNHEGVLIDWIHEARGAAAAIVINPGAYTHTSIGIHDALKAVGLPTVEVHLTNIHAREAFRRHSFISPVAQAVVAGFGAAGYELALEGLGRMLAPERR